MRRRHAGLTGARGVGVVVAAEECGGSGGGGCGGGATAPSYWRQAGEEGEREVMREAERVFERDREEWGVGAGSGGARGGREREVREGREGRGTRERDREGGGSALAAVSLAPAAGRLYCLFQTF